MAKTGLGTCKTEHRDMRWLHVFNSSTCRDWQPATGAMMASYQQGREDGYRACFEEQQCESEASE